MPVGSIQENFADGFTYGGTTFTTATAGAAGYFPAGIGASAEL